MKVLIISTEVWRNDQNGGNTLTWMFSGFPSDTEFAQVYCSEGNPDNTVCSNYYKLSTGDIARALIHGKKDAGVIIESTNSTENYSYSYSSKKNSLLVRITGSKIIRDIVWKTGFFKSEKLILLSTFLKSILCRLEEINLQYGFQYVVTTNVQVFLS